MIEPPHSPPRLPPMPRHKRESIIDKVAPRTAMGWLVLLVAILCSTGIAALLLEKDTIAAMVLGGAGVSGVVGVIVKLVSREH